MYYENICISRAFFFHLIFSLRQKLGVIHTSFLASSVHALSLSLPLFSFLFSFFQVILPGSTEFLEGRGWGAIHMHRYPINVDTASAAANGMVWFGSSHQGERRVWFWLGWIRFGSVRFAQGRIFFSSSSHHERNECVDGLIFFPSPPLVSGRGNSGFLREFSSTWIN